MIMPISEPRKSKALKKKIKSTHTEDIIVPATGDIKDAVRKPQSQGTKPNKCLLCNGSFSYRMSLKNHYVRVHKFRDSDTYMSANICKRKTMKQKGKIILQAEVKDKVTLTCGTEDMAACKVAGKKIKPKLKKYKCLICKMSFCDKRNFKHHYIRFHKYEKKKVAPILPTDADRNVTKCSKNIQGLSARMYVTKDVAKMEENPPLKITLDALADKTTRKKLKKSKETVKKKKCFVCRMTFNSKTNLKRHYVKIHKFIKGKSEKAKIFQSKKEDNVVEAEEDIESSHAKETSNSEEEKEDTVCLLCEKSIKSLNRHYEYVHKCTNQAFRLDFLERGQTFTSNREHIPGQHLSTPLKKHPMLVLVKKQLTKRHRKNGIYLKCSLCNEKFTSTYRLKSHLFFYHKVASPYKCYLCQKKLVSNSDLQRHLKKKCLANNTKSPVTSTSITASEIARIIRISGVQIKECSVVLKHCVGDLRDRNKAIWGPNLKMPNPIQSSPEIIVTRACKVVLVRCNDNSSSKNSSTDIDEQTSSSSSGNSNRNLEDEHSKLKESSNTNCLPVSSDSRPLKEVNKTKKKCKKTTKLTSFEGFLSHSRTPVNKPSANSSVSDSQARTVSVISYATGPNADKNQATPPPAVLETRNEVSESQKTVHSNKKSPTLAGGSGPRDVVATTTELVNFTLPTHPCSCTCCSSFDISKQSQVDGCSAGFNRSMDSRSHLYPLHECEYFQRQNCCSSKSFPCSLCPATCNKSIEVVNTSTQKFGPIVPCQCCPSNLYHLNQVRLNSCKHVPTFDCRNCDRNLTSSTRQTNFHLGTSPALPSGHTSVACDKTFNVQQLINGSISRMYECPSQSAIGVRTFDLQGQELVTEGITETMISRDNSTMVSVTQPASEFIEMWTDEAVDFTECVPRKATDDFRKKQNASLSSKKSKNLCRKNKHISFINKLKKRLNIKLGPYSKCNPSDDVPETILERKTDEQQDENQSVAENNFTDSNSTTLSSKSLCKQSPKRKKSVPDSAVENKKGKPDSVLTDFISDVPTSVDSGTVSSNCVYSCCGAKYFTSADLRHHRQLHHTKNGGKCDICGLTFGNLQDLAFHKQEHKTILPTPFCCPFCGIAVEKRNYRRGHMCQYRLRRSYKCPDCPKAFCEKRAMKKHRLKLHELETPVLA